MNIAIRRRVGRLLLVMLIGLVLGALLTELVVRFLPESATRTFFTTSVAAAFGPLVVDLVAVGLTLGPLVFHLNALSVVGVLVVALLRLFKGPRAQDRVVALDFLSVLAMLVLLALAIRYDSSMYFEAALVMALFGFVSSAAMAKFLLRGEVIE